MFIKGTKAGSCVGVLDTLLQDSCPVQVDGKFQEAVSQGVDVLLTSGEVTHRDRWKERFTRGRFPDAGSAMPIAGGVSVGNKDFIKPILERKGTVHFGKVRMTSLIPNFIEIYCMPSDSLSCWCPPGENEAWQAAHVCDHRGLGRAVAAADCVRPAREPREQHRHVQPGRPARAAEARRLEGAGPFSTPSITGQCTHELSCIQMLVHGMHPQLACTLSSSLPDAQEPGLRRVHARTQSDIKLDPERPEYHRVTLHWIG